MKMMPAAKVFQNEIIEIGAVKVNETLEIVDEFSEFIRPVINPELSDFCKELTTISQADVNAADLFPKVLDRFTEWIDEDYVLCSWGKYDKSQFEKDCVRHKLDTAWLQNHISLKHQHGEKVGNGRYYGMKAALKNSGLVLQGTHHRGIDDARNIAQLFIKYFDIWNFS